jgi:hypothetical protein
MERSSTSVLTKTFAAFELTTVGVAGGADVACDDEAEVVGGDEISPGNAGKEFVGAVVADVAST